MRAARTFIEAAELGIRYSRRHTFPIGSRNLRFTFGAGRSFPREQ